MERLRPPQKVELAGGERVAVAAVDVPTPRMPVGCWSYLTEGFARYGQAEILFLLRRTPLDPEPSTWPLQALAAVAERARAGDIVRAGGHTGFAPSSYLTMRDWGGWIYLPAQRGAGIAPQALHAVAVTHDELQVAKAFGAQRIAGRFARVAAYWPAPPWSEPHPSFAPHDELTTSLLASIRVIGGLDITVTRAGERVLAQVPRAMIGELRAALAALPADAPLAIATTVADSADAAMVWQPGQDTASAIHAPDSTGLRVAAAFLLLVPQQEKEVMQLVEDGYAAHLTDVTWRKLRGALGDGAPFSALLGGTRLELEWL